MVSKGGGLIKHKHFSSNPEIIQLSKEQKEFNAHIHNSKIDQTSTLLRKHEIKNLQGFTNF